MECIHRGRHRPSRIAGQPVDLYDCAKFRTCSEENIGLKLRDDTPAGVCNGCPFHQTRSSETENTFRQIANRRAWGQGESISGPGSSLNATARIRTELPALLKKLGAKSLLDIPCGDFHWMQHVDLNGITYTGADVVRKIVEKNRQQWPDRKFRHLDLITSKIPQADAVLVRDCLVHLPYHEIGESLKHIVASKAQWLITTHFPGRVNHNIPIGSWRPLDLTAAPFHLPPPAEIINEGCTEGNGAYADKSLGIWNVDAIRAAVARLNLAPKLTIGMATLKDWPGVWATIESIYLHHEDCLPEIEFIVIDNDPAGKPETVSETDHSSKARRTIDSINRHGGRARYLHYHEVQGTAAAKSKIFELATGSTVLVVDSHVMFPSGVIRQLIDWSESHPDSKDLWQGPCIGLNQTIGTDFAPRWGSMMYGQWNTDPQATRDDPFEIQMQGCGCFAIRRSAWPDFHPLLLKRGGFGPEEFHLHQRVRRAGGRCWCLPWLRWSHRFGNPGAPQNPGGQPADRLQGHLITHLDTGAPALPEIRNYFVDGIQALTNEQFFKLLRDTVAAFFPERADVGQDCPHREPFLHVEQCEIGCVSTRKPLPVFSCGKHGECAPYRWQQRETMQNCIGCRHRN